MRGWTMLWVLPESTKMVRGCPSMYPVTRSVLGDADPRRAAGDNERNWGGKVVVIAWVLSSLSKRYSVSFCGESV